MTILIREGKPSISACILFMGSIRRLVCGTPAVVNSLFDDIYYNEEKNEIFCTLYDHDNLKPILEKYCEYSPCKVNITWAEKQS